jgi:chromosome segregation ATPase
MEDLLHRLEEVRVRVQTLKSDNRELLDEKLRLKDDVSSLKVENELYKQEIETLKKELKALKGNTGVRASEVVSVSAAYTTDTETLDIKKQLNECIEEIDQCIHIIKTGQHVGK